MTTLQTGLVILVVVFLVFTPLLLGRHVLLLFFKTFGWLIFLPYNMLRFLWGWRAARRRRECYDMLGNYVSLLGNNPAILAYFRNLIEEGIKPGELAELLEVNVLKAQQMEQTMKKEEIRTRVEEELNLRQMAAEQQKLLHEARLSLEQIKFREQLLDGLYQKMRKKYDSN